MLTACCLLRSFLCPDFCSPLTPRASLPLLCSHLSLLTPAAGGNRTIPTDEMTLAADLYAALQASRGSGFQAWQAVLRQITPLLCGGPAS